MTGKTSKHKPSVDVMSIIDLIRLGSITASVTLACAPGHNDEIGFSDVGITAEQLLLGAPKCSLVQGKVVNVSVAQRNVVTATVRVDRIFCGSSSNIGDTFIADSVSAAQLDWFIYVRPEYQIEEEGIWLVGKNDKGAYVATATDAPFPLPSRKWHDPHYAAKLELSEMIATVAGMKDRTREIQFLKEQAFSPKALSATWAIGALSRYAEFTPNLKTWLRSLWSDEKFPLAALCSLDIALLRIVNEDWEKTNDRFSLLHKIVTNSLGSADASLIFRQLDAARSERAFSDKKILLLIEAGLFSEKWPVRARRSFAELLARCIEQPDFDKMKANELVLLTLDRNPDVSIRHWTAIQVAKSLFGSVVANEIQASKDESVWREPFERFASKMSCGR